MKPRLRRLGLLLLAGLVPMVATAQPAGLADRIEELRARARRIEEVRGHEAAEDALAHARRALVAARISQRAGEHRAAERQVAIADAALVLADRIAARRRARLAVEEVRERHAQAQRRAAAARAALDAALAERARTLRAPEAP